MNVEVAHKFSYLNREQIESSPFCGCFYCLETFHSSEIVEWVDEEKTALCPKCGIDSVIGSDSGVPITNSFLNQMHNRWF